MPRPSLIPLFLLACLAAPAPASTLVDDAFDDSDPRGNADRALFWEIQVPSPRGDEGVFERNGYLTLLAATRPYSFAAINSRLDPRLDFFRNVVSVTVEDLLLDHHGMPELQAMFRLSLNSTEKRQNLSPRSLSLRFAPGVVFLGYKTERVGNTDAENQRGDTKGSLVHELHDGRVNSFNLTLDPFLRPGVVSYSLSLHTDGKRGTITRTGSIPLQAGQWSPSGHSALVLEARRNVPEESADSHVSASIGRILVVCTPGP